ncbi:MAG TPA: SLC13 family permease [Geminicoccus sp.]|jgi:di/tricarboxylate transporter|uniref:SLC13 family permease n=1 Tax=Geminicoccus sp. TaxID=2024832 RepID=UPI002E2F7917|nr:SLC13 family permease [Geminicoccus sp.]HEX2525270.1 SLC13 family permease [Geminicoccus sp.]
MTLDQALAFALVGSMMLLFIWGRLRYDVVAMLALIAAMLIGIVPYEEAFTGFSDDIVIIVGSALVVSAAVARSGVMELLVQRAATRVKAVPLQVALLVGTVTLLSAFVKNIGALAIMIPVAFQVAKRSNISPSYLLMPMAFGSLLGGLMTLIGTSPNIIVAQLRADMTGEPFRMFDFTPVGLGLSVIGIIFLVLGYRLLPLRKGAATMDEAIDIKDYITEARIIADSLAAGQSIGELNRRLNSEVKVTGLVRQKTRQMRPLPDVVLQEQDILLLQGEPEALERAVAQEGLELEGEDRQPGDSTTEEIDSIEAIIGPTSLLVGQSAGRLTMYDRFEVNLLAVSRSGQRFTERLRDITLRTGDIVVLKGDLGRLPERLKEFGCLPLAKRQIRLGNVRSGLIPLAILGSAMTLTALGILPVAIAFFIAAVTVMLVRSLSLREAYEAVDWPILIMLGALIPVSEAIHTTGGTELIAGWLSSAAGILPGPGALVLIMVAAMAVTPFLNNAATVLVMGPIAASFATQLGYRPDAFLMAVAIGAGCDFLTPIGHQCNTLVMGPGGYRFGDYARLGAPLSVLVVVVGVPLIMLVWGL